jgi:predicted transposase YdaD
MLKLRTLANESRNRMIKERKEKGIPHNLGRKEGYRETMDKLLNKPKNIKIINLLKENNLTVRSIVDKTKSSIGTVMKLKKIIESDIS